MQKKAPSKRKVPCKTQDNNDPLEDTYAKTKHPPNGRCLVNRKIIIISWRTEERDGLLSDRTARVFELFFLDIPGFSGFLLLSYPVCGP